MRAVSEGLGAGKQQHIKLLNLQLRVNRTLEKVGLKEFFEVYTDRAAAIASF